MAMMLAIEAAYSAHRAISRVDLRGYSLGGLQETMFSCFNCSNVQQMAVVPPPDSGGGGAGPSCARGPGSPSWGAIQPTAGPHRPSYMSVSSRVSSSSSLSASTSSHCSGSTAAARSWLDGSSDASGPAVTAALWLGSVLQTGRRQQAGDDIAPGGSACVASLAQPAAALGGQGAQAAAGASAHGLEQGAPGTQEEAAATMASVAAAPWVAVRAAKAAAMAALHPAVRAHLEGSLGIAFSGGGFRCARARLRGSLQ